MRHARTAGAAWDEAEAPMLRFVLRALLWVGAVVASPFLALAFLFLLLQKPWWWALIPAAIGAFLFLVTLALWLFVRGRLRAAREALAVAERIEARALDEDFRRSS